MTGRKILAAGAVAGLGLSLAACGGGSVGSTPTPTPTPTPPPATYTKLVDMSGDRTFQTGGVQYDADATGFSNGTAANFGSGTTVAYTQATDTYLLTAPGGAVTASFSPANAQPPGPVPNVQQWVKTSGTTTDVLTLIVPSNSSGVTLSYTIIGTWGHITPAGQTYRISVGGAPTIATDMPKSGSANYSLAIGGSANSNGTGYNLGNGNSTATFTANFGTGAINTTLNLGGVANGQTAVTSLGTFTGTGTITGSGPGYSGTLTGTSANGIFSGAFFGPQALEMGFTYYLKGATFSAVGAGAGTKQ
ncbi:MAG: transferrin-binding protein-like solute binding protein [Novosphingobium sp.]